MQLHLVEYIYFIEAVGQDAVKIGYSKRPWGRLDNLKTGSLVELRMLWLFVGTRNTARALREHFQEHSLEGPGGGWFRLSGVRSAFVKQGVDLAALTTPAKYRYDVSGPRPDTLTTVEREQQRKERRRHPVSFAEGTTFGWLVVVEQPKPGQYKCRCRCGFFVHRTARRLLSGCRSCYDCAKEERRTRSSRARQDSTEEQGVS